MFNLIHFLLPGQDNNAIHTERGKAPRPVISALWPPTATFFKIIPSPTREKFHFVGFVFAVKFEQQCELRGSFFSHFLAP